MQFQYDGHFYAVHRANEYLNHSASELECSREFAGGALLVFDTEEEYNRSMEAFYQIYSYNTVAVMSWIGGFTNEKNSLTFDYAAYRPYDGSELLFDDSLENIFRVVRLYPTFFESERQTYFLIHVALQACKIRFFARNARRHSAVLVGNVVVDVKNHRHEAENSDV